MSYSSDKLRASPKVTDLRRRASDREPPERAVLSTLGHDRPGLVTALSALISDLGLSIEDSRMTVLGGEFAVLMSVTGSAERLKQLQSAFARFCDEQALASLFRFSGARHTSDALPYRATVLTLDHPGIVRSVAQFFSDRGLNIINLNTETEHAPHTGTLLFDLTLTVAVPRGESVGALRQAFAEFCAEQDLDGSLNPER